MRLRAAALLLAAWATACAAGSAQVLNPDWAGLDARPDALLAWGSDATVWRRAAGQDEWHRAALAHTGRLRDLWAAPAGPLRVLAGDGGLLAASHDGGTTWQLADSGTEADLGSVDGLGGTLMAGGADGVALRSTDGGSTWQRVPALAAAGPLVTLRAAAPGIWLAAAAADGRLWRSTDDGLQWRPLPRPARIDELVRGDGELLAATADGALWQSRDQGQRWRLVGRSTRGSFLRIAPLPGAAAWVATGQRGACAWRADARAAWRACSVRAPHLVRALASDPEGRRWVMVGEAGLLLVSSDRGRRWDAHPALGALIERRELDAVAWDATRGVFVVAGQGGLLLEGDGSAAGWRLLHRAPGEYVHDLATAPGNSLVAAMSHRQLARSDDGGRQWRTRRFDTLDEAAYLFSVTSDPASGHVVVGGSQGTVMVAPDGTNWRHASSGHGVDYLGALAVPGTATVLLHGTGGRVLRVDAAAARWEPQALPGPFTAYGSHATAAGLLVLVGEGGSVRQSRDGGLTWRLDTLGGARLQTAAATPDGRALLVAGDGDALYRAEIGPDGFAGPWQAVAPPGLSSDWGFLQADAAGRWLWLGGSGGRLLRSTDGRQWEAVATGTRSALRRPVHDAERRRWWLPGRDGLLLRSDDDGASWQRVFTRTTEHLKGVWVEPATGDVLAYGARLVRIAGSAP